MPVEPVRAGSGWLALREPADAEARSVGLVEELRGRLPSGTVMVVHDLGSGTGSMLRWLSPRLPGPQRWVLHDRDAELLDVARTGPVGTGVAAETRHDDITLLGSDELADASLVTASALLDMMTADELERLVDSCVDARCPVLVALSVTGQVELSPPDPLDEPVRVAFNAHQRRDRGAGRLLGPDAAREAADRFTRHGWQVRSASSPWRLGSRHAALTRAWLSGWVAAARRQDPGLASAAAGYVERRLTELDADRLSVAVHHLDLLALPPDA